ncbi:MAG: FlgO family outer membrane protein [Pseudomonadota bacterium]
MKTQGFLGLGLILGLAWSSDASAAASQRQPVAVFPFKVLNKDPRAAHLGEGASEHIITHLVQSGAVEIVEEAQLDKAIKRLAKGQTGFFEEKNALELGRMVNARYVIVGTVQLFGYQVAINSRLLEVETSKLVIAESIHGKYTDIFTLYEKLATRLKDSLINHLSMLVTSSAVAARGGDTNAVNIVELLAKGEKLDPAYGGKDLKGANMIYRQAVLRDPDSAAARRRLAGTFLSMERYDEAKFNLEKAVEVEPKHAWAQAYLGYCLHKQDDEAGALVHYSKALETNPNDMQTRAWMAGSLLKLGRAEEAREEFKLVLARDPSNDVARRGLRIAEQSMSQARKTP